MDKSDSDGFFSRRLVYRSSNRSYNSTDSSLSILNSQLRLLISLCILILLTWHTHGLFQLCSNVQYTFLQYMVTILAIVHTTRVM